MIRKTLFALALLFAASAQAQKVSALTEITSGHATGDLVSLVDVSDTTMAATGTNKKSTLTNLFANIPGPTNAVAMSVTGQSLTGSNASTLLNLATTWNTSGTPTALKLNVTDTASNASSLLMDLQVGGSPQFRVRKSGQEIRLGPDSGGDRASISVSSYTMNFSVGGTVGMQLTDTRVLALGSLTMGPTSGIGDVGFARNSANVAKVTDGSTGIRGLLGGGASVASATALPVPTGRVFHVTGTTTITSITSTNFQSGVCITLIFDGALTFTDGSNLKLAGDFVTTADDTINLCYDGTSWFETSRSVN